MEGGTSRVFGTLPTTGGWGRYRDEMLGVVELEAGRQRVRLRPNGPCKTEVSDLRGLRLVLVE